MKNLRLVSFYLPQFHPIPENSRWWGAGFTEWYNVVGGRPQFRGHYQPHLPGELGFYDLRLAEVREAQAELARRHGVSAFCYYHYWFSGRRLLERPFDEVLSSGRPDFPFLLCWANEPWTRRWNGFDGEVLMEQRHSLEDDVAHIRWLIRAFEDERYVRIGGSPVVLIYRPALLESPERTAEIWRREAERAGFPSLRIWQVEGFAADHRDPRSIGFDASVEFQPDLTRLGRHRHSWLACRVLRRTGVHHGHRIYSYADVVERMLEPPPAPYRRYRCVTPSWDNTARRPRDALIFHGSTPGLYRRWLEAAIRDELRHPDEEGLVFINAWNEWAEGNHLEPCQRWGRGYLEATAAALAAATGADADQGMVRPKIEVTS